MKMKLVAIFIFASALFLSNLLAEDENFLTLDRVIELSKNNHFEQKEILEDINLDKLNQKIFKDSFLPEIYLDAQFGQERNLEKVENDTFGYIVWKNKLYESKDVLNEDKFDYAKKDKDYLLKLSMAERKILAIKAFFDTNSAMLFQQYLIEQLAMDAIYHNRAKDFYPYGRTSDVEVLEKETNMLLSSAKNYNAEENVYNNKSKLANLLGFDVKQMPELQRPKLQSYLEKKILDNSKLLEFAFKNDPRMQQYIEKMQFLDRKLANLKNNYDVQVGTVAMYGNEPQKTIGDENNRWEARLTLRVPFYDQQKNSNEIQSVKIEKNRLHATIEKYKVGLSEKIDELVSRLNYLKRLEKAYKVQFDYRNLYLEKSRIDYDLNRKSDLGDSMVQLSKAEYELEKNRYEFVITYETLNLLVGEIL